MRILPTLDRIMRRAVRLQRGEVHQRRVGRHDLHWYEAAGRGEGPPVVLVHGLGGNANTFFTLLAALRRAYSRVYVPDLPGHGFSPMPAGGPIDIRGHYEALGEFFDEVVRAPAVFVGNSMGGALSLHFAIERGDDTAGLGLLAPAGAPLDAGGHAHLARHFRMRSHADGLRLLRTMMHRPPPGYFLVGRDILAAFGNPVVHHVLHAASSSDDEIDTAAMRRLEMPVTLVWGAAERLLPPRGIDFFREHLPGHARIEVFEKCGHVPMIEQPSRTAAVLRDLASHAAHHASQRSAGLRPR
jgi:pimeloyl-ACP methyl ester carboxylesterase